MHTYRSPPDDSSFPDVAFRLEMYAQAYVTHMELQTPVLYLRVTKGGSVFTEYGSVTHENMNTANGNSQTF